MLGKQYRDRQFYKFSAYGFLKNLRFFDPYFLLFFLEMGLSYLQIGVLFSIREVAVNLLEIPSGMIADGVGRRRAMIASFVSYIGSFVVFFLAESFWQAAGGMVFFALGEAFRTGTHKAMILDYLKEKGIVVHKFVYYGATRSWSQRGSAINALIAGALVLYSGSFRTVFLYSVLPYVLLLFLLVSYPKSLDGESETGKERPAMKEIFGAFFQLLKKDSFRRGVLIASLGNGSFKAVKDYIQPLMAALALSIPFFGSYVEEKRIALVTALIYSLLYFMTSYAARHSGQAARKIGPLSRAMNFYYLLGALAIFGSGAAIHFGLPSVAVAVFVFFFIVQNLRRPVAVSYVSDQVDSSIMATGLSGESQLTTLVTAVMAPGLGALADLWGLGAALGAGAVVLLCSFPFIHTRRES